MDALIPYLIWAVVILIGLGIVAIAAFGVRNLIYGKVSPTSIAIVGLPIILAIVLGMATGSWQEAAIVTTLVMLALGLVALLLAGLRGIVNI
jgi:hypothetical protein